MTTWAEVPAGDINAATQRLWCAVGDSADEVATRIIRDPAFLALIARMMINGGYEPSTSQKLAREIMGTNFFGIEEAIKHFGVNPSKQQLAALAEVPFSEEVLRSAKDTHVLVAVFRCRSSTFAVSPKSSPVSPCSISRTGTTSRRSPRTRAKSAGSWSVRSRLPTRPRRRGMSSKRSCRKTRKRRKLRLWSTP